MSEQGAESGGTRESCTNITIDREMYEELRERGSYIGEDPNGNRVHLSEDFRSVGRTKSLDEKPDHDTWGPMFPVQNEGVRGTRPVTETKSKYVLLEAVPKDTVEITTVHEGMRRIPEKMVVKRRANTYHGPVLDLSPNDEWDGRDHSFQLTCPHQFSHLDLWRAVVNEDGFVQTWTKIAKVSAEIRNVAGYDICEQCEEPIKDPMHRRLAVWGQCPGGMNDGENHE